MIRFLSFAILVLIFLPNNFNLQAAPFDTGIITLTQPNDVTFVGRIWGDEFFWWAETESGYRFVQSGDGWYYYAELDANGEFAKTTNRVGIDSPPVGSYQLERTQTRIDEIKQQIEEFNEQIELNRQWFAQKQAEVQGQSVALKVGIILIEFADTSHYRNSQINRPDGYLTMDFDSLMFSYNYWYEPDPQPESPHPENEAVFGSFRDYWDQISRGKLKIIGKVVNPDNDSNGVPDWLKASGTRQYYSLFGGHILAQEAYDSALASGYISEEPTDSNYYDNFAVVYALEAIMSIRPGGFLNRNIFYLAERSGPNLFGGSPQEKSFSHIGTYLHEFGHNLGFYDEYIGWTEDGETDLYNFCLMAWGCYNGPDRKAACPSTLSPFYRIDKTWVTPDTLTADTNNFVVQYDYGNPKLYRINPIEATYDEHYIIETRNRDGFDLYIPSDPADTVNQPGQLIVWQHYTNSNYPLPSYKDRIRIKQADNDTTVNTQINDFFPGFFSMYNHQSFNDTTAPAATINETYPFLNQPGEPAHFALNGIQKLANGNTLIDQIIPNHPLKIINENSGGWQTVSVPHSLIDYSPLSVFPTIDTNSVYKYQSGYIKVSSFENGSGYYANFPAQSQTITFRGSPIEYLEFPLINGWNLTGSISFKLPLENVCTDPTGILTGNVYFYDGGYHYLSDGNSIKPGIGYWIKTNNSGDLILDRFAEPCELPKITFSPQIDFSTMDKFIITDSNGNSQNLYVSNIDLDTVVANLNLELPPYFSELDFDSRFEYNEFVKKVSSDSGLVSLEILVRTSSFPVSFNWEINPENGINYTFINDSSIGKHSEINSKEGQVTFNNLLNGTISLLAIVDNKSNIVSVPTEFAVSQNYPNPFNPITTIKFAIPKESYVNLTVFNILGEKVKELKNETIEPGFYEVNFDASNLASGIYLYRIQAGEFVKTKKMLLLR
jgi:M6 family metalloprotease-like protein